MKKRKISKFRKISLLLALIFTFAGPVQQVGAVIMPPAILWAIKQVENRIPQKLKSPNGNVDLGQFKDKYGNTPRTKSSGSFKNTKDGSWTVEKDTAGHGGRKWKLKQNGKRVASLDGNGKVISD